MQGSSISFTNDGAAFVRLASDSPLSRIAATRESALRLYALTMRYNRLADDDKKIERFWLKLEPVEQKLLMLFLKANGSLSRGATCAFDPRLKASGAIDDFLALDGLGDPPPIKPRVRADLDALFRAHVRAKLMHARAGTTMGLYLGPGARPGSNMGLTHPLSPSQNQPYIKPFLT